jgi:hypothetical protein
MIPLILPTCLRVSTPTTASASIGPDVYPLVSTVNILHLHASPPSLRLAFAFMPHLSPLPLLSCRFYYSVLHPGEISGANYRFLLNVRCLPDSCAITGSQTVWKSIVATVSADQMRRNRRCTFIWLRSEICSLTLGPGTRW